MADRNYGNPLESPMIKVMEQIPEFIFDLASAVIFKRGFYCSVCNAYPEVVSRICQCGMVDRCEQPECMKEMEDQSVGFTCFRIGTLRHDE